MTNKQFSDFLENLFFRFRFLIFFEKFFFDKMTICTKLVNRTYPPPPHNLPKLRTPHVKKRFLILLNPQVVILLF